MMKMNTTLLLIVIAVVMAVLAFIAVPSTVEPEAFSDQGEIFFPDFIDPFVCKELEVYAPNPETATVDAFSVKFEDGLWRIPSHNSYPADAKDRMATAAAALIGLKKDMFRSNRIEDRTAFGVEDPLDDASSVDGRGKRVIMKDASGRVLADVIVGKNVENRPGTGMYGPSEDWAYIREPDSKRIYGVNLKTSEDSRDTELLNKVSPTFSEWIDTDLLHLDKSKVEQIVLHNYSVNESTGTLENEEIHSLTNGKGDDWIMEGLTEEEMVKKPSMDELLRTLDDLLIVGVRPTPEKLSQGSLIEKGFFINQQGGLFGNEGQMAVTCDDGVMYHLFFGEVLFGSGEAVSAGSKESTETGEEDDQGEMSENRYFFVRVSVNPEWEDTCAAAIAAVDEEARNKPAPEEPTAPEDGAEGEDAKDKPEEKSEAQKKMEEWEGKLAKALERVEELNLRFSEWFYVISGESFRKLRLDRGDLVELKAPDTTKIGAQPETPMEPIKNPSGLSYIMLERGTEGPPAADGDTIKVLYTGWLKDGTEFDRGDDRENPFVLTLGQKQVIKGWEEGLRGMRAGDKRKLIIPPDLAYGAQGSGDTIPPDAMLIFDVEMLEVVKP